MEYPSGLKFEGKFKEGKRMDEGVKILPSGDKLEGTFRGDDFVSYGMAKKTLANGMTLEGSIQNDLVSTTSGHKGTIQWPEGHK